MEIEGRVDEYLEIGIKYNISQLFITDGKIENRPQLLGIRNQFLYLRICLIILQDL